MEIRRILARACAKYSCKKWNGCRPLRVVLRYTFWWLASPDVRFVTKWAKTGGYIISTERRKGEHVGKRLSPSFDLYCETFYGDYKLYKLVRDDDSRICDPSKMVVGYATSYCATMVRFATGRWLKGKPCDSKHWVQYLADNGFTQTMTNTPNQSCDAQERKVDYYYIGVLPKVGEHGLVVWTNGLPAEEVSNRRAIDGADCTGSTILCSTYVDGRFKQLLLPNPRYGEVIWVKIS